MAYICLQHLRLVNLSFLKNHIEHRRSRSFSEQLLAVTRFLATTSRTRPAVHSGNASARSPKSSRSRHPCPSSDAYSHTLTEWRTQQSSGDTYHHPWPSNSIPHGSPICLLQTLSFEQYTLSKLQMKNPPRNDVRPNPIIAHIIPRIFLSLLSSP